MTEVEIGSPVLSHHDHLSCLHEKQAQVVKEVATDLVAGKLLSMKTQQSTDAAGPSQMLDEPQRTHFNRAIDFGDFCASTISCNLAGLPRRVAGSSGILGSPASARI